jgi:hypothetical protein
MDGIYEANITPDDIRKHRKEAADRAAERLQKQNEKRKTEAAAPYKPQFSLI